MKKNNIGDRIEEKYTRYLNCEIDTLELTIEEAIFILETDESLGYVEDLLQEAYKVVLSDYKRVLKETERYKNMYKAEHEIHLVRNEQLDRKEKAIIRCNELENENKELKKYKEYYNSAKQLVNNNYIPVQKIKDKMEELDKTIKSEVSMNAVFKIKQQEILQELLDGSDTDVSSIESED